MTNENYGIIESAKPKAPPINLLRVPHKNSVLIVGHPAFSPRTFDNNIAEMQKKYSHDSKYLHLEEFSFDEPTTSESISAAAYKFAELAKPSIFDPRFFQTGRIVRTSDGVYANPPRDQNGKPVTDETILRKLRDSSKKINGIYLGENDFGFAPYESFTQGVQEAGTFVEGGLAKVLYHTDEKTAKKLADIASPKFYNRGVNVWGFEPIDKATSKVASLGSGVYSDGDLLYVSGNDWDGGNGGCAFGVYRGEQSASK